MRSMPGGVIFVQTPTPTHPFSGGGSAPSYSIGATMLGCFSVPASSFFESIFSAV